MLNWTLRLWHQWNSVLISISFWCDQETMFGSNETSKTVTRKIWKNYNFSSFDRSRIPFDWSNVPFDRSNRNWESIESTRDFVIIFFNFSIDRKFLSIDRICLSIDWIWIESRSSHPETLKWICWTFWSIEKYLQSIEWTVFWNFSEC